MPHPRRAARAPLAAVAAALTLAACADPAEVVMPADPSGGAMFRRYVALGNSITAGYQSGGINDSTQRESYARLLADAMGTRYAYPLLAAPGCPPPIANFQTQSRGADGWNGQTCGLRAAQGTGVLNNVAVPGATSLDPTVGTSPASNVLTTLILGGTSQVSKALQADPTFVSVWIGNNDVLGAALSGVLEPTPGVSPGLTPPTAFAANFDRMADSLALAPALAGGVAIGVVNVVAVPVLFPAAALQNPAFKGGFDAFAGATTTVLPNCAAAPGAGSLVSFQLAAQIRAHVASGGASGHPPVISCRRGEFAASPLVGELFVLDVEEQAAVAAAVTAYNAAIAAKATALGWAFFDPNPALGALRLSGAIPPAPALDDPTNPFGLYMSLDGVHPRGPAHVLVANGVIGAINARYDARLPAVP